MAFRIRQVNVTAGGRRILRDRDLDKPQLSIGRDAASDVHLPDLAVEPQAARITDLGGGRVSIVAAGTLGFVLDGRVQGEATVSCRSGAELRFGSSRISLSCDEDGAALLTIEAIGEADAEGSGPGVALASILPSRRLISWLAALLILGLFLAWPITSHLARGPDPKTRVAGDASWSTGKLSLVHHGLEQRCEACHVKGFEAVRDATCLTCHKDIQSHAAPARLGAAGRDPPLGEQALRAVAHSFGKPPAGACTDCHTEHEGAGKMALPRQQFCAGCHGGLKDRLADTLLGNAADFGTRHPQFRPQVVRDPASGARQRLSLDAHPRENNGLFFPHKLHLDALGGVAKMAASIGGERGYGSKLACKDCHRPSEDGVRFMPITMERDCESCHSLVYDKVGPTFRTLKHGNIPQMIADLSLAQPSRTVAPLRPRPGDFAEGRPYFAHFGSSVLSRAFARDGVCGECHTPVFAGGKAGVMPVVQPTRYMQNGWFDHKPHRQQTCASCHHAEGSSSASDLLLPKIAECRTCHLGEAARADVPSRCTMCHSYHPSASAPREAKREGG